MNYFVLRCGECFIRGHALKINFRLESVGFLLLLGYLAFIPAGPFPIYVVSGLRLDVCFGLLLFAFIIVYFGRIKKYPDIFILAWLFYFSIVFLSTIFSVNIETSARNAFVISGYSIIALLVPVVFVSRADTIRKWLFLTGVLVSIFIMYLYLVLGFARGHRFALSATDVSAGSAMNMGLAAVDPNMTAAGLILALIVYFPNLFVERKRIILDLLGSLSILSASLVTLSRSAMFGFVLSISVSFLIVFINSINLNNLLVWNRKILVSFAIFLVAVFCVVLLGEFIFPEIIDKLT